MNALYALACPICGARADGSSYLVMAVVLLIAPLVVLGCFALWVRKAERARQEETS